MIKASDAAPIHISLGLDRGSEINQVSPGGHGQSSVTFTGVFRRHGKEGRAFLSLSPGVPHPAESSRENTGHQHHCQAILREGAPPPVRGSIPHCEPPTRPCSQPDCKPRNAGPLLLSLSMYKRKPRNPAGRGYPHLAEPEVTCTENRAPFPTSCWIPEKRFSQTFPLGAGAAGPWANSRGRCQAAGLGLHLSMD